jgi:hypothetical protein
MEFHATGNDDGTLTLGRHKEAFKQLLRENGPVEVYITVELRESNKMRRWFEGGLVPLIAFYQEGMNHRDADDRRKVREWLKAEFNGEIVEVNGKAQRIAQSTKGRATFYPFVERVQDWLIENYNPPVEAVDPKQWKLWKAKVFPIPGTPDNYIDYLVSLNKLKSNNTQ